MPPPSCVTTYIVRVPNESIDMRSIKIKTMNPNEELNILISNLHLRMKRKLIDSINFNS